MAPRKSIIFEAQQAHCWGKSTEPTRRDLSNPQPQTSTFGGQRFSNALPSPRRRAGGTTDQNSTFGASRCAGSSSSKNSSSPKPNMPATMFAGTVWMRVLYFMTESL